jgi:epoxyqueuosine reductase
MGFAARSDPMCGRAGSPTAARSGARTGCPGGLGWQGKHTNLISLDLGNWFFLGALLTSLPLAPDPPMSSAGHCGTCTRCLAACPTGALIAPLTLDARRCVSYLTIEHRGSIPRELRPLMGARIFGCDDCLEACPWNERARAGHEARLAARDDQAAFPDLLRLLHLLADEDAFKREFQGTPLLRPKRAGLRRNVCVALGNVGDVCAVPHLADVLSGDPAPLVRGHAAWALGRIAQRMGGQAAEQARQILSVAHASETENEVRDEIAAALVEAGPD